MNQDSPTTSGNQNSNESFIEFEAPVQISDFSPEIQKTIARRGWPGLMPVQARVTPYMLDSKDVIVQSRTGSGKTAAFLLPLCEKLKNTENKTRALIMVPTRELARQVYEEFQLLAEGLNISAFPIYGGTSYKPQIEAIKAGVHILIGTPGRLLDHLMKGTLNLRDLKFLVFDEADELLSMGFYQDMVRIGEFVPRQRTSAMFSATMPESVKRLAGKFLKNPEFLGLSEDGSHISDMDHIFYTVDAMNKDRTLMRIIELENPENAIIFCNTRTEVEYVAALLKRFGYDADQISGNLSQGAREIVMNRLKKKDLRFLVATDIAARGIDVSNLEYVIIYDMHKDFDQYVHRAGRTARAGNRGVAITLVTQFEALDLKKHARRAGLVFEERPVPTEEHVQNWISQKLSAHLEALYRDASSAVKERTKRYSTLLSELKEHENADGILMVLLDSFHQKLIKQGRAITEDEPLQRSEEEDERTPKKHHGKRPPQGGRRPVRPRSRRND